MGDLNSSTCGLFCVCLILVAGHSLTVAQDSDSAASLQTTTVETLVLSQTDTSTFIVQQNGFKCIKAQFKASLFITYVAKLDNNKSSPEETDVMVPPTVEMKGGCEPSNTYLLLSWRHGNYSIKLVFDKQSKNWRGAGKDKSYEQTPGYSVSRVEVRVDTSNKDDFPHPINGGVHVTSMAPNHTIFWAPAHHSYKCENKNFFTLHEEKHEGPEVIHNLKLEMWDVHLQAYDDVTEDAFSTAIVCEADTLNTLPRRNAVPVIVAACLAGVIIIIVLAYVINNRISSSAYKPMPG